MVQVAGVPLPDAIQMATTNPARALGLEKAKGTLQPGAYADFVFLSPELQIREIFLHGRAQA